MRIGIDVGGTHTDAVLLDGDDVLSSIKALTTADVTSGIHQALEHVLSDSGVGENEVEAVMLGTTQFTNAVVERKQLASVAAVRIGLPSGEGLPPMIDWPEDIADALGDARYLLRGGTLYDGRPLADLDMAEVERVAEDIGRRGIRNVAISAVFSPMTPEPELAVARYLAGAIPGVNITCSHRIGRLGLLERENGAPAQCRAPALRRAGGAVFWHRTQSSWPGLPVLRQPERWHPDGCRIRAPVSGTDLRFGTHQLAAWRQQAHRPAGRHRG